MKQQIGACLHNRFDIEVRDAQTGELKQQVTAYNIILNQMWARLCAGSSYFANIGFGSGTGTLDVTRTGLFTYIGYKAAVNVETSKALPTSYWKRSITLNAEDNVGATITEVGIMYDATSSHFVTHALLKDAEGTSLSITKTATDVVIIYATVYLTLSISGTNAHFIGMPDNNVLINWIIGGSGSVSGYFSVGECDHYTEGVHETLSSTNNYAVVASLGLSAAATWTADAANKKRYTGATRFGIDVGNGHIKEFGFTGLFRVILPSTGIFTGQAYTGVSVGTGDGAITDFALPSRNVDLSTLVIYKNGTALALNTDYTLIELKDYFLRMLCDVAPMQSIGNLFISPNKQYGYVYCTSGTYMYYYYFSSVFLRQSVSGNNDAYSKPAQALLNDGYILYNTYLYNRSHTTSYAIQDESGNTITVPSFNPITTLNNLVAWGNKIYNYNLTTKRFTLLYTLPSIPLSATRSVAFTNDGKTIAFITAFSSPNVTIVVYDYDSNTNTWIVRTTLNAAMTSSPVITISDDGLYIVVSSVYSSGNANYPPVICKWNATTQTWTSVTMPTLASSYNLPQTGLSEKDTFEIEIWLGQSDRTTCYKVTDSESTIKYQSTSIYYYGGIGCNLIELSADKKVIMVGPKTYPLLDCATMVHFLSTPASGDVLTADYTVNGIHKTNQYVIDISFAIQFGEGS